MAYKQILYHIIFSTQNRSNTISEPYCTDLYRYIQGVIQAKKAVLYRINGTENHLHFLSDLPPTIALSDYIKDIKVASSLWLKENKNFPKFIGWAEGYAALTYAFRDKDMIINYIKKQKEHHHFETFEEEFKKLLIEHGVEFDEKFLP